MKYLNIRSDGTYIDGTIGGAGHSSVIYERLGTQGRLIGIDQDSSAIEASMEKLKSIKGQAEIILVHNNFKNIKDVCLQKGIDSADGILLDLGVSSHQLDEAERGFSYQKDAPLDMRMDRCGEVDAAVIVNDYDEQRIRNIIRDYGEEKWASRIAKFILDYRRSKRIETTYELVNIIKAAVPAAARREGPHPAKRTFQALRIAVNNELGILEQTIDDAVSILGKGGRLCIITFHSLEDRIVKNAFQKKVNPCTCPKSFPVCVCGAVQTAVHITRKPVTPSDGELNDNPRSRSAKLRVIEKL
jgi:16S rRNA (cytosine1402-N4)-methyltransferase